MSRSSVHAPTEQASLIGILMYLQWVNAEQFVSSFLLSGKHVINNSKFMDSQGMLGKGEGRGQGRAYPRILPERVCDIILFDISLHHPSGDYRIVSKGASLKNPWNVCWRNILAMYAFYITRENSNLISESTHVSSSWDIIRRYNTISRRIKVHNDPTLWEHGLDIYFDIRYHKIDRNHIYWCEIDKNNNNHAFRRLFPLLRILFMNCIGEGIDNQKNTLGTVLAVWEVRQRKCPARQNERRGDTSPQYSFNILNWLYNIWKFLCKNRPKPNISSAFNTHKSWQFFCSCSVSVPHHTANRHCPPSCDYYDTFKVQMIQTNQPNQQNESRTLLFHSRALLGSFIHFDLAFLRVFFSSVRCSRLYHIVLLVFQFGCNARARSHTYVWLDGGGGWRESCYFGIVLSVYVCCLCPMQ